MIPLSALATAVAVVHELDGFLRSSQEAITTAARAPSHHYRGTESQLTTHNSHQLRHCIKTMSCRTVKTVELHGSTVWRLASQETDVDNHCGRRRNVTSNTLPAKMQVTCISGAQSGRLARPFCQHAKLIRGCGVSDPELLHGLQQASAYPSVCPAQYSLDYIR